MRTRGYEREPTKIGGGSGEHGAARAAPAPATIDRLGNRGMLAALAAARRPRAGERGGGLEQAADAAARGQGSVLDGPRPTATADASARALIARTGGGVPLDARVHESLAGRIGAPAGEVRVHAGARAAEVARSVAARAFTVGSDIVFGEGAFRPDTEAGRGLLAHELAHAAQQHHAGAAVLQREPLSVAQLDEEIRLNEERAAATEDKDEVRALFERRQFLLDERRLALAREQAPPVSLPEVVGTPLFAARAVTPQGPEPLVDPVIELAGFGGGFSIKTPGEGAVPPIVLPWDTAKSLAWPQLYASSALSVFPTAGSATPLVDWNAGNLRGLGAESSVLKLFYPDATQLPEKFPGFDYLVGGQRTPLTGLYRGQPLSGDSFYASGGTLIQLKTLKNSDPTYVTHPSKILSTLKVGMDKMENRFGPGTGRSVRVGSEMFRVEHAGNPTRKILHVVLETGPTAPQAAALADAEQAAASLNIKMVVTTPPKKPVIEMAPGTMSGAAGLGLAALGMWSKSVHAKRKLEEEGYFPPGAGAYESEGLLVRLGAFFRGDAFAMPGDIGQINMPVWRRRAKDACDQKAIGDTFVYTGYNGMEQVDITYRKGPDGRWSFVSHDGPAGVIIPDLNLIIDPGISDDAVMRNLTVNML